MTTWRTITLTLSALALALGACGDDGSGDNSDGPFAISKNPILEVWEGGAPMTTGQTLNVALATGGEASVAATLELRNLGEGTLRVDSMTITATPSDVFWLEAQDPARPLPASGAPMNVEPGATAYVHLMIQPTSDGSNPSGMLTIKSNSAFNDSTTLQFPIAVDAARPTILVNPAIADFGNVQQGDTKPLDLQIRNVGADPLVVDGFTLTGSPNFEIVTADGTWTASAATASKVSFPNAYTVDPGGVQVLKINFSPDGPEAALADLRLFSNDPTVSPTEGTLVPLQGNVGGPCIAIKPQKVDFGGKLIGKLATIEVEILSCGDAPLEISEIRLMEGEEYSSDFSLDLSPLEGVDEGSTILSPEDPPISLGINETQIFRVNFLPDEINPLDDDGKPIADLGMIHIVSNTFVETVDVEVKGFGVEVECPTAVIKVQEGEEVIPQTKLHLVGSQSFAPSGSIAKYEWTVIQPAGSQSVFLPSASAPDPTFEVNVAGSYVFMLEVWDQDNVKSCVAAEYTVLVNPDEAIHVELLWHTPNDTDETDEGPEAGADVDLHFLHPFATGLDVDGDGAPDGWFDNPFDCFWFNNKPDWGSHEAAIDDDPGLDRDDTDGAGPENLNLNIPEDGLTYRVGVHYWNDHGFGPSYATVRIYIMSVLVFEVDDVELVNHDLWEVATVAWPSGDVTAVTDATGGYKITPDYEHPLFLGE